MPSSISDASDASVDSLWSCIIVAVLPEDLAATCNSDCTLERCDLSTVRPCEPAETGKPGVFKPFKVTSRKPEISELPKLRLTYSSWAEWTNKAPVTYPLRRRARMQAWHPVTSNEIYLFLGILICMGIHPENKIERYWSTKYSIGSPYYAFTYYMPRERFELLLRRLWIWDPEPGQAPDNGMPAVYQKVNGWSAHI
ncbi:hypothetical protein LX36DRAFT_664090 [Colletotrichum falcatum]|nr:hypothetical protein LX36DRAFT_664090 [Colletotrichum falcatum]